MTRRALPWFKRWFLCSMLAIGLSAGCDLPQNSQNTSGESDDDTGSGSSGKMHSWIEVKIIDLSSGDGSEMSGLDIDAITILDKDGDWISSGCASVRLEGADTARDDDTALDATATLTALDGDAASGGFLSLGGGVFTCTFHFPIPSESVVYLYDVESDGTEPWQARFIEDALGNFEEVDGDMYGSSDFEAP